MFKNHESFGAISLALKAINGPSLRANVLINVGQ